MTDLTNYERELALLKSNETIAEYRTVLTELVACKDLADATDGGPRITHPNLEEWRAMRDEYNRRWPCAWQTARALIKGAAHD